MMNNTNINLNLGGGGLVVILVIFAALAFVAYDGSVAGVIGMALLVVLLSVALVIALVPIGGFILYFVAAHFWIIPWTLNLMGLEATWVVGVIGAIYFIFGCVACAVMTLIVAMAVLND